VSRSHPYTGIGSRKTPKHILDVMVDIARELEQRLYCLRSGGAEGADMAFESGVRSEYWKEIYLPWPGFNGHDSTLHTPEPLAFDIAARFHPAWGALSPAMRKLMARNVHQVLGVKLSINSPSKFVVCWTPDGAETMQRTSRATGGTGQAIRIASANTIPVFNLANDDAEGRLWQHVASIHQRDTFLDTWRS